MAPSAVDERGLMTTGINGHQSNGVNGTKSCDPKPHDYVHFDPSLKPKSYGIKGTSPDSKILFRDVNIIDSESSAPFRGDVYVEGEQSTDAASEIKLTQCHRRAHKVRWRRPKCRGTCKRPQRTHRARQRPNIDERSWRCTYAFQLEQWRPGQAGKLRRGRTHFTQCTFGTMLHR